MSFRRSVPIFAALAALTAATSVRAQWGQQPSPQAPPKDAPNAVSPVLILPPTNPPKMVSTYPAQDQAVMPGVLILKVAFDQQMSPSAWNYAPASDAEPMDCVKTPRLLNDQKTFVLLCRVVAGKTYGVTFNGQRPGGFANLGDNPAQTATLTFKVQSGDPISTIRRAMEAANLQADQMPIQDAPSAGGQAQSR